VVHSTGPFTTTVIYHATTLKGSDELDIAPDDVIQCDLELVAVVKESTAAEADPENRILMAEAAKSNANKMLIAGEIPGALRLYTNALNVLEQDFNWIPELKSQSRMLKMAVTLNVSLCQFKLGQYFDTIGILTEVIKQDDECVKAYYRMGQSWFELEEYRNSKLNYEKALSLDPSLQGAMKAVALCTKLLRAQEMKDRSMYKGMFK
jgi:tetratricopeptide (TPR) repeat protein